MPESRRIGRVAQTGITTHHLGLLGARYAARLASSARNDSLRSAENSVEVGRPPAAVILSRGLPNLHLNDLRDHNLNLPSASSQLPEPKGPPPAVPPNRGRPLVTAH